MAYVFNPFTGNFDIADTVTFSPPLVDLTPYEKKVDSEQRDQDLQDQIDALEGDALDDAPSDGNTYGRKDGAWEEITAGSGDVEEAPKDGTPYSRQDGTWVSAGSGASMPEPPDDGVVYGRKTESGVSSWEVVTAGPGGGNTVWTADAGEDSPTVADGVQLNDLLYRPAKDQLFIWRVFDLTGQATWMQILANPGGGGTPGDGAIDTITVTAPLTKTGPLTDPVLGIDLSDYAEKTDIPEKTSELTNDSGFITAADVPDTSSLESRVASLEGELATLKAQMAKVLQTGDKIVGAMTTPDSGPDDAAFNGNIEIQL